VHDSPSEGGQIGTKASQFLKLGGIGNRSRLWFAEQNVAQLSKGRILRPALSCGLSSNAHGGDENR